jgi:cell division protein FtsA
MSKKSAYPRASQIAALDIGTSKVACFIGRVEHHGALRVIGVGHTLSKGIRAGIITDIAEAEASINAAVYAAEQMADESIEHVVANIHGNQILSHHVHVGLDVVGSGVHDRDVIDLQREAKASVANGVDEVIHCFPLRYSLDDHKGIQDPRGMVGNHLAADFNVMTVPHNQLRNLSNCLSRCHLNLVDVVLSQHAAALGCLEQDELELGVMLIEIGGGSTNFAIYHEGRNVYSSAIPVGGLHVTSDIAKGLSTNLTAAERLKVLSGSVLSAPAFDQETIDVPPLGESSDDDSNYMPRSALVGIIRPRMEEIFEMVRAKVEAAGVARYAGRQVVLTGGGCQIPGTRDLAARVLGKQVRIGRPRQLTGLADAVSGPAFSTTAGILEYAHRAQLQSRSTPHVTIPSGMSAMWWNVKHWVKRNF